MTNRRMEEFLYNYIFYYLKNLMKVPSSYQNPENLSQSYKLHYKILALWWKTSLSDCQRLTFTPPEVFYKKGVLRYFTKFTGKYLCQSPFFNEVEACNFIKKETLAQVFSCGLCENSQNTFFHRTPLDDRVLVSC